VTLCTMANSITLGLQAESTKRVYSKCAADYEAYRADHPHSEAIVLAFLTEASKLKAASTLWTTYSLVKKYLLLECSFDLGAASRISDFLKTLSRYHKKKKAPAFSRDELFKFLREAPNSGRSLVDKLIVLTGFYGGLRSCELVALTWADIVLTPEGILVNIARSKTDQAGVGAVKLLPANQDRALCPTEYFAMYKAQVPHPEGRLFRWFQDGKFTKAPLGKTTITGVPRTVAAFLCLENPNMYTGHALRVTSATVLADEGANSLALKRHGRWKSEAVAEEYLRESKHVRCEAASMLSGSSMTLIKSESVQQRDTSTTNITFTNCVFNASPIFQTVMPKDNNNK
jgi:integrase